MPQLDEPTLAIARILEVDWQDVERVEAWVPSGSVRSGRPSRKLWVIRLAYVGLWLGLLITVIVQGTVHNGKVADIASIYLLVFAVVTALRALRLRRRTFATPPAPPPRRWPHGALVAGPRSPGVNPSRELAL